jgi:hypothetical protein
MNVRGSMLLTLRVTEERKRISSVATYRVPHIDTGKAAVHRDPPTADQLMTTPHVAAFMRRVTGQTQSWLVDGGF